MRIRYLASLAQGFQARVQHLALLLLRGELLLDGNAFALYCQPFHPRYDAGGHEFLVCICLFRDERQGAFELRDSGIDCLLLRAFLATVLVDARDGGVVFGKLL